MKKYSARKVFFYNENKDASQYRQLVKYMGKVTVWAEDNEAAIRRLKLVMKQRLENLLDKEKLTKEAYFEALENVNEATVEIVVHTVNINNPIITDKFVKRVSKSKTLYIGA
jgi:hypothetical protein